MALDVVFESDPAFNNLMKRYFKNLKTNGMGFEAESSEKYGPITNQQFHETLGTIEYKGKESKLLQIADTYVYAIARGRYEKNYLLYRHLRDKRRIMDFSLNGDAEMIKKMGVKHYCFD